MKYITAFIIFIGALGVGHAQIYKYVDEKGRTQYSNTPMGTEVKNLNANTLSACDAQCQKRMADDKINKRYEEAAQTMPAGECAIKHYPASKKSKELAQRAREECKRNYAMKKADPNYQPSTSAAERNAAHNDAVRENLSRVNPQGPNQMTLQGRGKSVNCQNIGGGTYNCY